MKSSNIGFYDWEAYIKGSNTKAYDEFGSSLALDRTGRTLIVSARRQDDGGNEAGAAYAFRIAR